MLHDKMNARKIGCNALRKSQKTKSVFGCPWQIVIRFTAHKTKNETEHHTRIRVVKNTRMKRLSESIRRHWSLWSLLSKKNAGFQGLSFRFEYRCDLCIHAPRSDLVSNEHLGIALLFKNDLIISTINATIVDCTVPTPAYRTDFLACIDLPRIHNLMIWNSNHLRQK